MLPSKEYLEECFTYEPETGLLYWKKRPLKHFKYSKFPTIECNRFNNRYFNKEALNSINRYGYKVSSLNGKCVRAHRVIWKLITGIDAEILDHIDGDKTNNRIQNLRNVTQIDNQKNQKRYITNMSGTTGVFWNTRVQKWQAFINKERNKKHLGYFDNFEEAVDTRKKAEVEFGYHINHGRNLDAKEIPK